jgi:hypothetical protein
MTRRLGPEVLTRISSNVASGGGGVLHTTDKRAYENQVRFLVTSIDTQFQQTSTGVFVAFHHLAQELQPMGGRRAARKEVSRGSTPDGSPYADEELRKRIMGGLAVKF